jgi:hypothetical protein
MDSLKFTVADNPVRHRLCLHWAIKAPSLQRFKARTLYLLHEREMQDRDK